MSAPDMDVIKEIPGYKVILKAILKSQIQQLVEQLATTTNEESVILTASVVDGTLSHLGSDSGKTFLEDNEDIKSQFLGFCLKRHHKRKQDEERAEKERQEALRNPPVTPPRYGAMGPRGFMPHGPRSPRFGSPLGPGLHPVALARASPRMRHEPYPMARPPRRGPGPGLGPGLSRGPKLDGQVIKIEPDDDGSNHGDSGEPSQPSSPSVNPSTPQTKAEHTDRDDDASESSSSTIPNESSDLRSGDNAPPGGLSLDSDLSNIISAANTGAGDSSVHDSAISSQAGFDPNVSVKTEEMGDSEMDLEITGVELGQNPPSAEDWTQGMMGGMPTGASGGPGDMASGQQGYNDGQSSPVPVASSNSRFRYVSEEEMKRMEHSHQAEKTRKNTKWAVKLFQEWHMDYHGEALNFESVTEAILGELLRRFYVEAAPQDNKSRTEKLGETVAKNYHKNTLKNIRSGLNRHLADIGRKIDLVHGVNFKHANRTLDGFLKEQTKSGNSRPTQHKPTIEPTDLQKINEYLQNAQTSPIILRQCVWYNIGLHFITRGLEFHKRLKLNSFEFTEDDGGLEYVTLSRETQQKNFQLGLTKNEAHADRKMYATGASNCPVATLKLLISRTDPASESLFNRCNPDAKSEMWFIASPLSARTYCNFMRDICKSAETEGCYTAHSLTATARLK